VRGRNLLTETDLSLPLIADRSGFAHSEYLSTVFKQQTGQTISEYRRMLR